MCTGKNGITKNVQVIHDTGLHKKNQDWTEMTNHMALWYGTIQYTINKRTSFIVALSWHVKKMQSFATVW